MQYGRDWVFVGGRFVSTISGKAFEGPDARERVEADNRVLQDAKAGRDALPQKPRSVNYRIAQERAAKNPTGPNPWTAAKAVALANVSRSNFTDHVRQEEIADLEAAELQFEERKAKLAELPRPVQEGIDPLRQTAESLRARPDKLGERVSNLAADLLDRAAINRDEQAEAARIEQSRIDDPTYQRAVKYLELEIHKFERSVVPPQWLDSARSQLEQVRAGTLTAYEWWHAFQPERVNEQAEYYERLAKSKQDEIAPHLAELERIKAGDLTPPADNPNPPADPGANP